MKGALLLSNQVSVVVHDLEQKRVDCLKTQEKIRKEKEKKSKAFKVVSSHSNDVSPLTLLAQTAEQLEKEKSDSKWETSKVKSFKNLLEKSAPF